MADEYRVGVYVAGCGELVQQDVQVDDRDPEIVVITVRAFKPDRSGPEMPLYDLPLDDPRHRCVQGLCDDHAGPPRKVHDR